jgi:glycosyltransferase involved in cell wall biosynthesis
MDGEPSYKPLVSVIIPNYNHAAYLNERIDSVLNQTFRDFEVILLDDCSTDNSREIIESYRGHEKISQIEYNEVNSGSTFIQWKKGLDLAQGDWIWIAESDDAADELFLSKIMDDPSPLNFSNSRIIDFQSNSSDCYGFSEMPSKKAYPFFKSDFVMDSKDFTNEWMLTDNFIPNASAVVFSRTHAMDVMNKIRTELSSMKLMGDWLFWILFLQNCSKVRYLTIHLNSFRIHENTVRMKSIKQRSLEMVIIFKYLKQFHIPKSKTISTFLFRYLAKESFPAFTFKEHVNICLLSFRYGFFTLYSKSLLKKIFQK